MGASQPRGKLIQRNNSSSVHSRPACPIFYLVWLFLFSNFQTRLFSSIAGNDEIDFDRAASAFPDISLDGTDDIPVISNVTSPVAPVPSSSGFSFDDFDSAPTPAAPPVKVTGDDEIDKFESEFPDIDVPVSLSWDW